MVASNEFICMCKQNKITRDPYSVWFMNFFIIFGPSDGRSWISYNFTLNAHIIARHNCVTGSWKNYVYLDWFYCLIQKWFQFNSKFIPINRSKSNLIFVFIKCINKLKEKSHIQNHRKKRIYNLTLWFLFKWRWCWYISVWWIDWLFWLL